MNKDVKEKWVAALRSGEYQQGVGCLRRHTVAQGDEFCCLGVLCDLYHRETSRGSWSEPVNPSGQVAFNTTPALPTHDVLEWAEVRSNRPFLDYAGMNDRGCTFAEIADAIERAM